MTELFLLAELADQRVAFPASEIDSIVDIESVTQIPLTPPHVVGLAAVRSQIVTVIDVAVALNESPVGPCGRAVIVVVDGHRYALRVAGVDDITQLPAVLPIDRGQVRASWRYAASGALDVNGRFALLLDPAQLVASQPATPSLAA